MPDLLQVVSALAIVLALIVGASWLLQSFRSNGLGRGQLINIQASVSVGTRERLVLVEVGGEWLLVGVAPGHINTLLRLDESPLQEILKIEPTFTSTSWLSTYIAKHRAA
jgi:flagellar protein FliO/FliZ